MDLQNNMIRRAITIAVNKAIENMQSSPERSSRNLLDLGLFFTKSYRLRNFYETAKKILANPNNSYHQLIKRVVTTVDQETVKTVGINLGLNSLNYGAKVIRKMQENMDHILPWLLTFQISDYNLTFLEQIKDHIADGQKLGIYSYVFILENLQALPIIINTIEHYADSVFMLIIPPQLITREHIPLLSKPKNLVISVSLDEALAYREASKKVFRRLLDSACLYGFHIYFTPQNAATVSSEGFLQKMLSYGCAYGSYLAVPEDDDEYRTMLKTFVNSERQGHGQPILAFDWLADTDYIGKAILPKSDYLVLDSQGQASLGHKSGKQQVAGSLTEIIQAIMPPKVQYSC